MPQTIRSDPTRLRQVLMNIAGNAIKFTAAGEVRITARLRQIGRRRGRSWSSSIADTGIGIPAEKLESIFDPFTQADSSITRQFGGTGLGLAISRRLAEIGGRHHPVAERSRPRHDFTCEIAIGPLEGVPLLDGFEAAAPAEPAAAPQFDGAARRAQPSRCWSSTTATPTAS